MGKYSIICVPRRSFWLSHFYGGHMTNHVRGHISVHVVRRLHHCDENASDADVNHHRARIGSGCRRCDLTETQTLGADDMGDFVGR
jgi:hypothetical protein